MTLDALLYGERANAVLGWASTAVLAAVAVANVLAGSIAWGGLVLSIALVASLPALAARRPSAMVSWPLPALAASAVALRTIGVAPDLTGFVTIGSIALIVVVELDVFTEVELSRRFAVVFAVMTTMAVQALWTVVQFGSDRLLETAFIRSQTDLQWDFVSVTAVSVVLGVLAKWFFERFEPVGSFERPPSE